MIARLTGRFDAAGTDWAVIDVGGVGYLIHASGRTLARLGQAEGAVSAWIDTHVREDRIVLYAFFDTAERDWFRLLITVQGVGPKVALAILGTFDPESLHRTILAQDRTALCRADGVGAKLATRVLAELKDKAGALGGGPAATTPTPTATSVVGGGGLPARGGTVADAVSALVNLGYGRTEAFTAVQGAARILGGEAGVGALISAGLKDLSR
ncbi:Holliday junction branch migration complex subunit RuvA [uncultured Gammaproteobacteria bacterium]